MEDQTVDFDEIEWGEELERTSASVLSRADVSASRSLWGKNSGSNPRVRTTIVLRNDFVKWVDDNGPRFSINLDSTRMRMRIMPNNAAGKFEATEFKTVRILRLGYVKELPNTTFDSAEAKVTAVESATPYLVIEFPSEWLTGKQLLLPAPAAPVKEVDLADGIPSGVRKVLTVLTTNDSVSHGYLPSLMEMQREDVRKWVDETKKWLAGLKPPVVLNDQKYSYFLAKADAARLRKILEA